MVKITSRKTKKLIKKEIPLFEGLILGIFITLAVLVILNFRTKQLTKVKDDGVIAPYYTSKSFEKPTVKAGETFAKIKLPVIMYHYVEYVEDKNDFIRKRLDIVPHEFEKQLLTLKENEYETYFTRDMPDILAGRIYYSKKAVILTFDDGYEDFYKVVYPLLKKYNMRATVYVINDFIGRRGFLTKDEVQELSHSGLVEIGAHTMDHVYLKNMTEKAAKAQIIDSKMQLEEIIGREVVTFAYPYGAFDDQAVRLVKEASFSAAVSVMPGIYHGDDDLFTLFRIRPGIFTSSNIIKVLETMKN